MILIMSHFRFSSALMRKPLPRKITNALMLIFTRAYIRLEKRFTNLGGLYLGELIHGGEGGGQGVIYGILRYAFLKISQILQKITCVGDFLIKLQF